MVRLGLFLLIFAALWLTISLASPVPRLAHRQIESSQVSVPTSESIETLATICQSVSPCDRYADNSSGDANPLVIERVKRSLSLADQWCDVNSIRDSSQRLERFESRTKTRSERQFSLLTLNIRLQV